jgi:predicted HAD superfamily phosphohydrolase YqeG
MSAKPAVLHGTSKESISDDIEKEIESPSTPIAKHEEVQPNAQASGDRTLVLMDLDNGLVGWESASDPDNPQ